MKLAFVVDPLELLKPYKDSSIAMMREAARRGHEIHVLQAEAMFVRDGAVRANTRRIDLTDDAHDWYRPGDEREAVLGGEFDVVLMRKDPPFDQEYYYATLLLDRVAAAGARVVNSPRALRDWNEKLSILAFPQFIPPTLVTSAMQRVQDFIDAHGDVIVKKLDGMGGTMIFRVTAGDVNRNVIVETITDLGSRTIMAQKFIPEIAQGDKRVLVIDGKAFSHCLARIPKAGETRGNLAAGGRGVAQPISARDREIGETVGAELVKAGIVFAGLDVIGDGLTEINVTSPTGIVEIAQQTGRNAAKDLLDVLERSSRATRPG
jgi:glutathione synthase